MRTFLRATAGGYDLLLDCAAVQRVAEAEREERDITAWAGRALPVLDLSWKLGGWPLDRSNCAVIIYAAEFDQNGAVVLAVDEINGLVNLEPQALMRLPTIPGRSPLFFDRIAVEPIDGRYPLCLRERLDIWAIERDDA
jgi:chemotaxis signal transduction protein